MDNKLPFQKNRLISITPEMFDSPAFKSLSKSQLWTLMRCLQNRTWTESKTYSAHKGGRGKKTIRSYHDNVFEFSYAEAKSIGIGGTQFSENIRKLIEVGFLDLEHQGGWFQSFKNVKNFSKYKNSLRWKAYSTSNFVECKKPPVLQPHFYIQQNIKRKKSRTNFAGVKLVTSLKRS